MYAQFEAGLQSPDTEIYKLEIPGGQYSNFKPQATALGLGHRFEEVKQMYSTVNQMLGDIVKVTPSSKMVGDLAIFMVQNHLTPETIVSEGMHYNFPDSVVSYFSGMMGQPQGGFPEDLQRVVLKGEKAITCRPGELLAPVDFEAVRQSLPESHRDDASVLSACLYPKVFEEYLAHLEEYGDLSKLETPVFMRGMDPGDLHAVVVENGKVLTIKFVSMGEMNDDGTRNLIFELNGIQRVVAIKVPNAEVVADHQTIMADPTDERHIAASIPGLVSKVLVQVGDTVEVNETLCVIEAMKMETNIVAKTPGRVVTSRVAEGSDVKAGELLFVIEE